MNRILSIFLMLMLLLTSIVLFSTKENASNLPPDSSSGKAQVGGAFTLIDSDGKTRSDTEFRGKNMLVFFGFTHCPHICPTTMATITSTMNLLGDKAALIAPIFITIDVKNDTPARLKEYFANFDPRIVGLTGSDEQIKAAASAYKTFYAEQEGGMMDHSSLLYLMNEQGEYVTHFAYDIAPDLLAKKLLENIKP
jgi:cytochrome oxidase Cu insertion factor (SCO1/SenC/PrrC family)